MAKQIASASKPLLLYSLYHPTLLLTAPLAVSLEYDLEANQTIAYAYDLQVFGYGETEQEALSDLRRAVIDLYFELKVHTDNLRDEAQAVWQYLSSIMEERVPSP